jgi:glycine betaine/proline transport system ATP-binding protein
MSIIKFDNVDVIFSKDPREALKLLDQGMTRDQILKKTGQIVGVEKATLEVEKGEICVLMGLSGSGKSSLLRCINGLNTVSRGALYVEHEGSQINIANCTPAELKLMRTKRIAMVFQKFALMPWLTVRENISFGLEMQGRPEKERRKLVDEKLELVGLTQWRNKKPDELSGGMQQRVGLARALAMDADILLMDEPFSALDPLIRQGLQDELLELQSKLSKTIVFVSHDLDEALKLGSRIAIMKDGRIIQYSVPEEIVLNPADDYVRTFVAHTNPLNVQRLGVPRPKRRFLAGTGRWQHHQRRTSGSGSARPAELDARPTDGHPRPQAHPGAFQHRHARRPANPLPDRQQTGAAGW